MKTTLIALAAATLAVAAPSLASAKIAQCDVYKGGNYVVKQECDFSHKGPRGSFRLRSDDKGALTSRIDHVDVKITRPGFGVVYARLANGRYVRWGAVRRSTNDRACWVGSGLKVCAS